MTQVIPPPTLSGFTAWVRSAMGITTSQLPDDSIWLQYAFNVALEITNTYLNGLSPTIYNLAVYNLGGDNLVNWAQDVPNASPYKNNQTYFVWLRAEFGINDFSPGFVVSASDEGSSVSIQYLEVLKSLTLTQLQNTKTPYGRQYLGFSASWGTNWGLS